MSRHSYGRSPRPWSKLKSRVEAPFAPGLPLAIHCNVFVTVTKEFTFDEPRHWVMLGHGRAGRIIWDFPGPFLRPAPGKPPRSTRGPPLDYWETGYGCGGRRPSEPSALMCDYLDRPRDRLMEPFETRGSWPPSCAPPTAGWGALACWVGLRTWTRTIQP